jgi:4-diphosphocytidyl-2-C-methyl-D-erythritol kinase
MFYTGVTPMPIAIRSFAKINLGLKIGPVRADGFHELRTIYQTLALHDVIQVHVQHGSGIEIRCNHPRVPLDDSNTCHKVADRVLKTTKAQAKVIVQIDKRLPVQGGLGAGSSNAVATMLGLERALETEISAQDKMRIAAEIGSDVPLFLIGGTVLGVGHGEEVYPLQDLSAMHLVVVTPATGVSTPKAFALWDELVAREELTGARATGTIKQFSQAVYAWLSESVFSQAVSASQPASGVPAVGGDRAETPLLDLVRAGIENDFERVVFPEYPDLRGAKRLLQREGARYASLSGSGSTLYGLFDSGGEAQAGAERISASGVGAVATSTLNRNEYWQQMFV